MTVDRPTLIEFPCDFPIKIIGIYTEDFISGITTILMKHFPETTENQISHTISKGNNYVAMTASLHVLNQAALDALYQELTAYPGIKMVL